MKRLLAKTWLLLPLFLGLILGAAAGSMAADSASVMARFADPPRQYATAPLWVWNDMLTEEQIRSTLRDLAGQQVKQAFVHPRPGLMTPYLSADWFRLWRIALDEAQRLDMNIWIYDENSYPSGFAGGLLPDAMPESRGRGLVFRETDKPGKPAGDVVAVYRLKDDGVENVTGPAKGGEALPQGRYLVASVQLARTGGWFGGKYYVDLLHPGVTEKFIDITMEAYRREIGDQFGKRVPGWFTDEPHLAPAGGLHWSDDLPERFQKRWGYDLLDHLPSLKRPIGDWQRVRHNYYNLLLEQFIECWARPCYEYCEKHNLEFTGHYWEHGWPGAGHGGDNMAMYAWHQRPAIDTLMNQYREDTHAQFGNVRAVLELSSVANQLGRKRTLCEAYGAGGWDLRLEDVKRIGDWLYVLGVNTLDEHLSYITIRGARKRDHPQSFSYHTPWWEAYHVMARYFTRLSLVLSEGEQVNRVLLIEPTTTAWMYQGEGRLNEIGNRFQELVVTLAKKQVEFDLGCEDIMGRQGSIDGAQLVIGQRRYETVVLPPLTENLNAKTIELLQQYAESGGTILCCGPPPERVDGKPSQRGLALSKGTGWKRLDPAELAPVLLGRVKDGFAVRQADGDRGILFHHRRRLDDGEILFLVNTSIESSSAGSIESSARGVRQWDPATGTVAGYPFKRTDRGIRAGFELPPCGSLLLLLSTAPCEPTVSTETARSRIAPAGPAKIRRLEPNVLTIDYVDVTAGGETKERIYCYRANQFAFVTNGMDRNPWDSAIQLRDQLITRKFPPGSGFEATYRFTIKQQVPDPLYVVIERPDLYTITCNGRAVAAEKGSWWLDKSFGKVNVTKAARLGENSLTIKASPFTIYHELEPAYVLGNFGVEPAESGFVIVAGRPLRMERRNGAAGDAKQGVGWNRQGHPFYAAGVSYAQTFEIPQPSGRHVVRLTSWHGSVAKVLVNGRLAGYIAYRPWECDVSDRLEPGANTIEVVVIGTLKNTLGPHHAGAVLGAAWPNMFHRAPQSGPPPGDRYHTIDYGLFEPFVLEHTE